MKVDSVRESMGNLQMMNMNGVWYLAVGNISTNASAKAEFTLEKSSSKKSKCYAEDSGKIWNLEKLEYTGTVFATGVIVSWILSQGAGQRNRTFEYFQGFDRQENTKIRGEKETGSRMG